MGAAPAFAQLENLDRFERQLEQINRDIRLKVDTDVPAGQRALIDYGVYATFGFLAIDDPLQNTHILRQTDINAYVRINVDDAHEFYMRVLQRFTDWNTGDSFDGNDEDTVEAQFERIHYRFDLAKAREAYDGESINYNFVIQGGRQLVHWANGLALSQVLDGGSIVLSCENISLELMAGATRPSSVDFDPSRPGFAGDTHRDFYGAKLELQTLPEHRIFVYALKQHDSNHNSLLITDPIPGPIGDEFGTAFEYNSHYIGIGSTGNLGDRVLYSTEFVLQGGDSNSTSVISAGGFAVPVAQTQDDIDAYAFDIKIEYLADDS
jgi:hypothetical protein